MNNMQFVAVAEILRRKFPSLSPSDTLALTHEIVDAVMNKVSVHDFKPEFWDQMRKVKESEKE